VDLLQRAGFGQRRQIAPDGFSRDIERLGQRLDGRLAVASDGFKDAGLALPGLQGDTPFAPSTGQKLPVSTEIPCGLPEIGCQLSPD
jgi:hypothetical protein